MKFSVCKTLTFLAVYTTMVIVVTMIGSVEIDRVLRVQHGRPVLPNLPNPNDRVDPKPDDKISAFLRSSENQKYTAVGDIGCRGSITDNADDFEFPAADAKFAYVWYVASIHYLCAALTAMKFLKHARSQEENGVTSVDYVLIYVKEDLPGKSSTVLLQSWLDEGGRLKEFPSLRSHLLPGYYQATYQKFYCFLLEEYDRVILMDADGFVLHSLDHLFLLKMPEGTSIAAPQGYWFDNQGVGENEQESCPGVIFTMVTSVLMVVEPSRALFDRVREQFGSWRNESTTTGKKRRQNFDMDILNLEFGCRDQILVLPKEYGSLDAEYTIEEMEKVGGQCRNFSEVQYLHFTGEGKPWSHGWDSVQEVYLDGYDPEVAVAFLSWFEIAHEICPMIIQDFVGSLGVK